MIIKPTVGRVVWYRPSEYDVNGGMMTAFSGDEPQPFIGHVAYVWSDRLVNLVVYDHTGEAFRRTSVKLIQEGDEPYIGEAYCEWMPYQVGQAKKHEGESNASA